MSVLCEKCLTQKASEQSGSAQDGGSECRESVCRGRRCSPKSGPLGGWITWTGSGTIGYRLREPYTIAPTIYGVPSWRLPKKSVGAGPSVPARPRWNSLGSKLQTVASRFNFAWIQARFGEHQAQRLSSEALIAALADSEDSPWPNNLPLTKAQLARCWSYSELIPTIVHRSGNHVHRGYLLHDFHDIFARYLPK
jgi:Protein of unknown function (DUF3631)